MKKPKAKRTKAQAAAARKFAAAGRASQARKRAFEKAHGLPTRTKKQHQASLKWAAAGRAAQNRKKQGLKPLPKQSRALAGVVAGAGGDAGEIYVAAECDDVGEFRALYQPGGTCTVTAIANHLLMFEGVITSAAEIIAVHEQAGGVISDVLELLAVRGLAGTRIRSFWPVAGLDGYPGFVAGLRLPQGAHTVLTLGGGACASWGSTWKMAGRLDEAWWIEWE